ITINGLVTDKTCDIVTPAGKDFTVTLPTVSKQTLAAAGNVAGSYAMRIWLDPAKLTSYQLTPSDIATALQAQNSQVAVGQLGG
ncbi:efflux RND transporter permease subunit, partial [Acinetobacter nosocomialis]|uniref:efflux RND transporter permease subunit n=1 Tax=Acinetobacter nosocomialis TaxID=106654 RepID=UPI0020903DB1